MRAPEAILLEEELDDGLDPAELGFTIDLVSDDLEEDDLGLRSLYENPEVVLGSGRWPSAA